MFNSKPIALAFALSTAFVAVPVSAAGLPSSASDMATDTAKQQATDMAIEQGSAMAKEQLEGQPLGGDAAAAAPNAAVSADEAAELAETGEDEGAEDMK